MVLTEQQKNNLSSINLQALTNALHSLSDVYMMKISEDMPLNDIAQSDKTGLFLGAGLLVAGGYFLFRKIKEKIKTFSFEDYENDPYAASIYLYSKLTSRQGSGNTSHKFTLLWLYLKECHSLSSTKVLTKSPYKIDSSLSDQKADSMIGEAVTILGNAIKIEKKKREIDYSNKIAEQKKLQEVAKRGRADIELKSFSNSR